MYVLSSVAEIEERITKVGLSHLLNELSPREFQTLVLFAHDREVEAFKRGTTVRQRQSYIRGHEAAALIAGSKCLTAKAMIEDSIKRLKAGFAEAWTGVKLDGEGADPFLERIIELSNLIRDLLDFRGKNAREDGEAVLEKYGATSLEKGLCKTRSQA